MEEAEATALLLDHTQDKVAVLDEQGVFRYTNAAAERILGFEPADLVGENAFEFVHPEDREAVRASFEEVLASDRECTAETATYRHRTNDGMWVWLESRMTNYTDPALDGYVVSSREVTDRVEAERARRATEERLRELADTTDDVLWMFDGDWSELLFCNPAYEDIFGMSVDELEGDPQTFLDAIHPDDVPAVEEAMAHLSEGRSVDIEYRVNPTEDYDRWVWVQGEPIVEDGTVVRIAGLVRDVTGRRRRERQLIVMDNFLRHNLRNEMTAILGQADLIERRPESDIEKRVAVIRRAGKRLLQAADKQRDIVGFLKGAETVHDVDFVEIVKEAVRTIRERYPGATIETDLPEQVHVDTVEEISCAVAELVENPMLHCESGRPDIQVTGSVRDGEVALVVRDDCQAFPEFDRKVLTGDHEMDAVYHSSGCGLWLVYWTVDLSGGRTDYAREDGENVVTVTLPRAKS